MVGVTATDRLRTTAAGRGKLVAVSVAEGKLMSRWLLALVGINAVREPYVTE